MKSATPLNKTNKRKKNWNKTKPKKTNTNCKEWRRKDAEIKTSHKIYVLQHWTRTRADIIIKWLLWCVVVGCAHWSFIVRWVFSRFIVSTCTEVVLFYVYRDMFKRNTWKKKPKRTGSSIAAHTIHSSCAHL